MFTCVAYSEDQDAGGAFVKMAGVPDQHVKVQGDGIYIAEFNRLMGGMACIGTTGTEARIVSPTLRRLNPCYIAPIELDLHPGDDMHHSVSRNRILPLDIDEAMELEFNADPAASEQGSAVIWLANGEITPVKGAIFTVNVNITLALVAGAWAFSEIDFVDEIPVGNYDVVGLRPVIDAAVAARLVFVGGVNRPGAPCSSNKENNGDKTFRDGNLGVWGSFNQVTPPGVEVLSSAAAGSATYELYLDLIRR